jgi:serine protease Do
MKREIWSPKNWLYAAFVSSIVLTLTGCITPEVNVPTGTKLETYRKVYLVQPKNDPRSVNERISSRLKQAGFQVVDIKPDSPPADMQGSGFLITPAGHFLTCAHVVGTLTNATAWIGGQRYPCRVLASDTNLDLAVLLVEGAHQPFAPLQIDSEINYSMGQDAFSMGFPLAELLGTSPRLNKGMISATVGLDDDPKSVQFSAPVQPGNSGGPLLNAKCKVIGVISSTLNPMRVLAQSGGDLPQNVNFAIKTDSIRKFLAAAKITLPPPTDETSVKSFDEAQKSLVLVRAGNVTDEDLKQPALLCAYNYLSLWDMWFRFRVIEVRFYDLKKGDLILKAGQYQDDPFSSEDGELNRIFAEISTKFFPDQPNPFKSKK